MNMKPIAPMLAVPMSKANILDWNDWVMEEKFDGHRLVIEIASSGQVTAWTRERKHAGGTGKDQLTKTLPPHLLADLKTLAPRTGSIVLDGELLVRLPDGRVGTSTDVPRTELQSRLFFTAFDVLVTSAGSCMMQPYENRRCILALILEDDLDSVVLADARQCVDADTVALFCHEVWDRGGEGLILKHKGARYEAGKRREAFVKLKKLKTIVGTVIGFEESRGTVLKRGPFATVKLLLEDGRETSVKTKDDFELNRFNRAWEAATPNDKQRWSPASLRDTSKHPAIGRKLRIEYQDEAADGGVRHPRWDRWEDE